MALAARLVLLVFPVCALAGSSLAAPAIEVSADSYKSVEAGEKGIVMLDVYWGRAWRCGKFENAQLRKLVFEKAPLKQDAEAGNQLTLENPSELAAPRNFVPYAFVLEPGEYHLTEFAVKFARSISDVGVHRADRAALVTDGRSQAGTFDVQAGEVVYIGNFAVDCYQDPIPWRYYTENKDFAGHVAQYKKKYPPLEAADIRYRLFKTNLIGQPYEAK
jgi:hypothetical protein